jgi:WD40 repeat protein
VLCLDFSAGSSGCDSSSQGVGLAASGGRDALIHIYDARDGFRLLETLADDSTYAVTALRFTSGGRGLVSCSADGSILCRWARAWCSHREARPQGRGAGRQPRGGRCDGDELL